MIRLTTSALRKNTDRHIKHGGSKHEQDRHPLQGKDIAFFVPVSRLVTVLIVINS